MKALKTQCNDQDITLPGTKKMQVLMDQDTYVLTPNAGIT